MENGTVARSDDQKASASARQEVKAKNQAAGPGGHKRTISGGFLGSLPFLRSSAKDAAPKTGQQREQEDGQAKNGSDGTKRGSSLATALNQGRRRKGSLRKTAILGTGKMLRERRNSVRQAAKPTPLNTGMEPQSPDDETTPRRFSYDNPDLTSSSDSGWPPVGKLSIPTDSSLSIESTDQPTPRLLVSPLTSPVEPYASTTTDDDEGMTFYRPTASSATSSYNPLQLQPPGPSSSLQRRRSNRGPQNSTLTAVHTPTDIELVEEEWDYSETEWWGWVVLVATWVVFVVGMGSCLGVWSWAWDVGETPYAPPDLEDDPTLPITGYYPALIVCTAVMAWVWVVVAWVGMKYFRHAKMVGEDG
ncbi:hypothetical protein BDV96DRAFT_646098 [Lophiotrema nucula]|uniref:Uncharacterized protein n=1 Tax=Lophiotrema nucula TaxID=690887 RepID=A0A6A5Z9H5_9PLEO|nr:hypothetical protein BDV96DRAFT_646098 [Lophiotrema nucula]